MMLGDGAFRNVVYTSFSKCRIILECNFHHIIRYIFYVLQGLSSKDLATANAAQESLLVYFAFHPPTPVFRPHNCSYLSCDQPEGHRSVRVAVSASFSVIALYPTSGRWDVRRDSITNRKESKEKRETESGVGKTGRQNQHRRLLTHTHTHITICIGRLRFRYKWQRERMQATKARTRVRRQWSTP